MLRLNRFPSDESSGSDEISCEDREFDDLFSDRQGSCTSGDPPSCRWDKVLVVAVGWAGSCPMSFLVVCPGGDRVAPFCLSLTFLEVLSVTVKCWRVSLACCLFCSCYSFLAKFIESQIKASVSVESEIYDLFKFSVGVRHTLRNEVDADYSLRGLGVDISVSG